MSRILLEAHAHTSETSACGRLPAARLVESLQALGYGAVVITDHYLPGQRNTRAAREAFLEGYRAASRAGREKGMVVLPGMEIRFQSHEEDFLVYGMEEEDILSLPDNVCEAPAALHEFHELCKARGFMLFQAHPYRPGLFPANTPDIDGMEIFNGNPRQDSRNRMAALFASRHNLHTIAGSDIHREGDQGIAGLYVPETALTPAAFADWLRHTPHPRIFYQEMPVDGIRYLGARRTAQGDAARTVRGCGLDELLRGYRPHDARHCGVAAHRYRLGRYDAGGYGALRRRWGDDCVRAGSARAGRLPAQGNRHGAAAPPARALCGRAHDRADRGQVAGDACVLPQLRPFARRGIPLRGIFED